MSFICVRNFSPFSIILSVLIGSIVWSPPLGNADQQSQSEKTLSPYFFVTSEPEGVDLLPLRATGAKVEIAGVIANVTVDQEYKNEGTKPIEAIYVFPASTRAAVHAMKMTIGERVVFAKIYEREAAKASYVQAKQEGKSASLLEQERPNVFQMSVANIMPGDNIKVELSYTELLIPTKGTYEFSYPTVVGPRYSKTKASEAASSEHFVANPYLSEGTKPTYGFKLEVSIASGIPIQELASPSHQIKINYRDKANADVQLAENERTGGNRDFILRYRLEGKKIETGLQLYQGAEENFFLLMVQPPERLTISEIPPREYIFLVDVSGSMYGMPLETSKTLLRDLITHLRPVDKFNVILFCGDHSLLAKASLPATKENLALAISLVDKQSGSGGTELLPAMREALTLPKDVNSSRSIVLVTDGYIDFERDVFDLIKTNLNRANIFAFGIGSSVNRYLIEGVARAGFGEPFVVTKAEEAQAEALRFREYMQSPLLTNVKVNFGDFQISDAEPGAIPDLFAERPLIVFGKWQGSAKGKIEIRGNQGDTVYRQTIDLDQVKPSTTNEALRYLWARHRIASLDDDSRAFSRSSEGRVEPISEITRLGLKYNLLTTYTSFLAVDQTPRNQMGVETVKQPLPLPQDVSAFAVGNLIGTAPEPETYLLLCVLSFLLCWAVVKKELFQNHGL